MTEKVIKDANPQENPQEPEKQETVQKQKVRVDCSLKLALQLEIK